MKVLEAFRSSSTWWDWGILGAIVAVIVLCSRYTGERRKKRGGRAPPGPRPWPIVGNFWQLGTFIHHDLAKMAEKYGPIFLLRLGSIPTIVVSSPELAREVFKTHDRVFTARPTTSNSRILTYGNSNIAFTPPGPYWRHARKMFTLELLTPKKIQSFQAMRTQEVLRALHSILADSKEGTATVCMVDKFGELMWNIISRMMISERFFSESSPEKTNLSKDDVQNFFDVPNTFSKTVVLSDYIPLLRGLDVKGSIKQLWEARRRMDVIFDKIIGEHLRRLNSSAGPAGGSCNDLTDMVDVMLTSPVVTEDGERPLTMDQIKGILTDAFIAGTDTSAKTLAWAMAEMVHNPHVLERAQKELDDVVGRHRLLQESDIPHLSYLHAVVKETFRLHPVVPALLPRESVEDCDVGGYFIPAGTRLLVNAWAIGRDPSVWDRPLDFYPERFLGKEMDVMGTDFELLPFGAGRRMCPGKSLAIVNIHFTLASLLHGSYWCVPPGMKPEDMDLSEAPGLIMPLASPLHLVASPRLPYSVLPYHEGVA